MNGQIDDDKLSLIEELSSLIIKEKSKEELESVVRDIVFTELLSLGWTDLTMYAEDYGLTIP